MKYIKRTNFYELSSEMQRQILIKMFHDAGYDTTKWFFDLEVTEREVTIKELEDACATAVAIEDYEKASKLRDIIQKKKESIN